MATLPSQTKYEIILENEGTEIHHSEHSSMQTVPPGSKRFPSLDDQLAQIPKDAEHISIVKDVPTDEEWETLGAHLTSVSYLEVDAGFNEDLNDRLVPPHWPLQRLIMSSSCGDVTENPHILQGKVQHLVLLLTSGVRFEGPRSSDLFEAHHDAVASGEKEAHNVTDTGVTITWGPDLYHDWMRAKYDGKDIMLPGETESAATTEDTVSTNTINNTPPTKDPISITTLEILENDAIETFMRFSLALPHLAYNLTTLNLRSTRMLDLSSSVPESIFGPLLKSLNRLTTLVFSVGEVFDRYTDTEFKNETLPNLYTVFPPNLKVLRFRGPVSLTWDEDVWEKWIGAFADKDFLPDLERLSFVCDLLYDDDGQLVVGPTEEKREDDDDDLRDARAQCERLIEAVKARGDVVVEPFVEKWHSKLDYFHVVDERWYAEDMEVVGATDRMGEAGV